MKKTLLLLYFLAMAALLPAQSPQSMKYQGIVRDGSGSILTNQTVSFRFKILQGGPSGITAYSETHADSTNDFGLVNLEIGNGSAIVGSFGNINWQAGPYFLDVEIDASGGTNYKSIGVSQFLSVPYALHAKTSGDQQNLSLQGDTLSISGGNSVVLGSQPTTSLAGYLDFETDSSIFHADTVSFTVPNGKNLLISYLGGGQADDAAINGLDSICHYGIHHYPLILESGDQLTMKNGAAFVAQEIPQKYDRVYYNLRSGNYAVPTGKKLILLGAYYNCFASQPNRELEFHGIPMGNIYPPEGLKTPFVIDSGTVISISNPAADAIINGFLVDE